MPHRSTTTSTGRRVRRPLALAAVAFAALGSLGLGAPAAFAKGGTTTSPTPVPATRCGTITVTNSGQIVREQAMPTIKFLVTNCGTAPLAATVAVTETPGIFSGPCPSPVAAPTSFALAPSQKVAAADPVYRGPCGMVSQTDSTIVASPLMWQGHRLLLTLRDTATGDVLGSSPFEWHDIPPKGV